MISPDQPEKGDREIGEIGRSESSGDAFEIASPDLRHLLIPLCLEGECVERAKDSVRQGHGHEPL